MFCCKFMESKYKELKTYKSLDPHFRRNWRKSDYRGIGTGREIQESILHIPTP